MRVLDFPQGSLEWKQARAGLVTASRMEDVIAKLRNGGEPAVRRDYRAQLVAEILIGQAQEDGYQNAEMLWGIEQEEFARAAYEIKFSLLVDTVGLVVHPKIERSAASPDGLIGAEGLLEIKCPKTATHLSYLTDGVVPKDHEPQMMWQLACTERAWCDFVSYDPRLPEGMQLFVKRLVRDEKRIAILTAEVERFLVEVERMLETVRRFA